MSRVVAICGSPRKGNTERMLREIANAAKEKGADVEIVLLREADIAWCDGCLTCEDEHSCHIKDDIQKLYTSIENCDTLVLGTPVHFDGVSPQLKNLISRLNPFCDDRLKGKRIALAIVGQLSGDEGTQSRNRVIEYLRDVADILGMEESGCVEAVGRGTSDVSRDTQALERCRELGARIAEE